MSQTAGRSFIKMHGLGNDFVILDARDSPFDPTSHFLTALADRKRGIGCDQIIILRKPETVDADIFMDMYNADGSKVRACGNATRCVTRLLFEENGKTSGVIQTVAGLLKVEQVAPHTYSVDFGPPQLEWAQLPTAYACDTLHLPLAEGHMKDPCGVNMGNPHAVFFVDDVTSVALGALGPRFECDPLFPDRCNIEFAQVLGSDRIRMRVWERGAGITEACGTGASATLVAAARRGLTGRRATIVLDGGEVHVDWRDDDHVILAGPAALSYRGALDDDMFRHARTVS